MDMHRLLDLANKLGKGVFVIGVTVLAVFGLFGATSGSFNAAGMIGGAVAAGAGLLMIFAAGLGGTFLSD
jgi:hypothetical protein